MRKTRKAKKLICLVVSVLMLMGMLSAGWYASAASVTITPEAYDTFVNGGWITTSDGAANLSTIDSSHAKTLSAGTYYYVFGTINEWYLTRSSTVAIITVNDNGIVTVQDGTFAQQSWNQSTITPSSTHTAALNNGVLTWGGEGSSVTIKDGAGNVVNGSASVGVEEGSVFFTAESAYTPVSWSLTDNGIGATLNGNYNGGALVSFSKIGNVTLVATDAEGGKAQVVINVNNDTIQLNASTVNGAIANGSTQTIEQGQALDVLVDCTDPSKLNVTKTGSVIDITRGSTGVPITILGTAVGSSQVTLELFGKTLTFTVKVNEATTANFVANGSPIVGLTTVDKGTTIDVTCSLAVNSWAVTGGDTGAVIVVKNGNSGAKITGNTIGGLATVTAYGANNTVLGTFDVYVTEAQDGYYTNILSYPDRSDVSSVNMNVNETKQFIADCTIVLGSTSVAWELVNASPANCVTLTTGGNDGNGNAIATIKANAQGSATLKATANGISDTITITVGSASQDLTITPSSATVKVGQTVTLSANQAVSSWTSSNNSIATVSNGVVTGVAKGTVTITAKTADGKTATATVTVTDSQTSENVIVMKKNEPNAYVNGAIYPTTEYATGFATVQSINGTYVLPLRYIAEVNGMQVDYLGSGRTQVTNKATGEYLVVNRDSTLMTKYTADGTKIVDFNAPQPVTVKDTVTFAPMRIICEALGLGVSYQSTSHGSYVVVSTDTTIDSQTSRVLALIEEAYGLGL